jgi:hypothetical protein
MRTHCFALLHWLNNLFAFVIKKYFLHLGFLSVQRDGVEPPTDLHRAGLRPVGLTNVQSLQVRAAGIEPAMFTRRDEFYRLGQHNQQLPYSHTQITTRIRTWSR